jgi:hypothetical protein
MTPECMLKVSDEQIANNCVRQSLTAAQARLSGFVFGASETMPLRAAGYVMSATRIRDTYLPEAQLQIIHPLNIGVAANKLNKDVVLATAEIVAYTSLLGLHRDDAIGQNVHYLETTAMPEDTFVEKVRGVIQADPALFESFEAKATRRNASHDMYVAAHMLVHDSHMAGLQPLTGYDGLVYSSGHPISRPERIVSVGAQSERRFYQARMACRAAGVLPPEPVAATGQFFTRHVLPPYQTCRNGEPQLVSDVATLLGPTIQHDTASVERDLRYLQNNLV